MAGRGGYPHLYGRQRWKRRRLAQLQAEPLCRYCLARGLVKAANVADHVVPHKGDEHAFWHGKLQSLCIACHESAKKAEERGGRSPVGLDGWPLDQDQVEARDTPATATQTKAI